MRLCNGSGSSITSRFLSTVVSLVTGAGVSTGGAFVAGATFGTVSLSRGGVAFDFVKRPVWGSLFFVGVGVVIGCSIRGKC